MPKHIFVEVPAFLAGDAAWLPLWTADRSARASRVLKGRPLTPLPPTVMGAFAQAIVDRPEDRRTGETCPADVPPRQLPFVQTGNTCAFEVADSFRRGAHGVLGWPLGDPPDEHTAKREIPAGVSVVLDLLQRIERDEDPDELERVLRRGPALAYRLMRFINSPAFGLSVEISSFQHALMVLGTKRLKRWLALLVTGAVDDPELKPLMFLAVRRGLLMEELVRHQGDENLLNEVFICGVFSLLDRMLGQPFEMLLESLPVPARVADALAASSGPLRPWLDLAVAVEMESPYDIQAAADALMLAPGDLNRAVLISLRAAWQMRDE
ncbi:MAG: HDOD domain-containing protein [Ideonella sp.]|nr:HDOD domain-containing protein [Ideonella sp.]